MQEPIEPIEPPAEQKKMGYFAKHWHGQHSLAKSYWINYWLLSMVLTFALVLWFVIAESQDPVIYSRLALAFIVLIYFVIYPWQIVGLWRSANHSIEKTGKRFWPRVVKFIIVIGFLGGISAELQEKELYKELYYYAFELSKSKNYDVSVDNNILLINGDFDYGLSKKVAKALKDNPSIKFVTLNSDGGLLYEARELSKLILLNSLNTYTNQGCASACTIAFISGNKRYIHKNTNLGFHQYSMAMPSARTDKAAIQSLIADQQSDAEFFQKRGVDKEFTDYMYKFESDDMWYPSTHVLEEYGVIDGVLDH